MMGGEEEEAIPTLYAVVRAGIAYDVALPLAALRTYIALAGAGAWREWVAGRAASLARHLGYAPSTVYAALALLVKRGYLAYQRIGRQGLYHLIMS